MEQNKVKPEEESGTKKARQRLEIDDRYKWQLDHLYDSVDQWRGDLARLRKLISQISSFHGKLMESGNMLYQCLEHRDQTAIQADKLSVYANLKLDEDNRVSEYQAMVDEIAAVSALVSEAGSFIVSEIIAIPDERLAQMMHDLPRLVDYDHHLDVIRRSREHVLSLREEELLALVGNVVRGPAEIFRMIDDADVKFGVITDVHGEKVTLSKRRYSAYLESKDRRVRKEAMEMFAEAYRSHLNCLGATLATSMYKDLYIARARKYPTCLEASLDADNIPLATDRNLITTVDSNLYVLHRYTSLRKRVLGVDELHAYDNQVPLVPDANMTITYPKAVEAICEGLSLFGEDYVANLRTAFSSGWIDVYESEGKGSRPYSWSTYAAHPYILLNYGDTLHDMFVLSHEMGHAMHSCYSKSAQPYVYSWGATFTAEVASTINEIVMMHFMLERTEDKHQRAYLLSYFIRQIKFFLFDQVMSSQFEDEAHRTIEDGRPLSADIFRQIYREMYRKFMGPELTLDEYVDIACLRNHLFYSPFYVYQYATSYAAATQIAERLLAGDRQQLERYIDFLRAGGSKYPIEVLADAGVDMTKPDAIEETVRLFGRLVNQLEQLLIGRS